MSRFEDYDGEGMPYALWEQVISRALGGRRGQEALAGLEEALLALPEPKLIEGHLAHDGQVCAIGAYVAHRRAQREGVDMRAVVEAMSADLKCWCGHGRGAHVDGACTGKRWEGRLCGCTEFEVDYEGPDETAAAGSAEGMRYTVAWHLASLNDETFREVTPEQRYERMLAWVRRAQGKVVAA